MRITLFALALLIALSSQPPLLGASNNASPPEVLDTSAKILRADSNYYIVPYWPQPTKCLTSGGLGLTSIGQTCPLDVILVNDRYHGRLPLSFTPINPKKGVIRVDTDLNIKFAARTSCPHHSTAWTLEFFGSNKAPQWFVTTGGALGNPGWKTMYNWFKIEEYDGAYKLVHCPSFLPHKHLCQNVGVVVDRNGNKRLALTHVPLKVQFQKA
ncbi:miraculin-like [Arachis duranensis]|uniref:Miraculin-like n=1 Tax=Arachis duranensis TaxID=130453 RepID=A0A6P4DHE7_ARADU|nr:miraculin-like [Arachis duranensis]